MQTLGRFVDAQDPDANRKQGERLPTLVNDASGLPLRLALHWSFGFRRRGLAALTLDSLLRAVGHLYFALDALYDVDLDALIFAGREPTPSQLTSALKWCEERGAVPLSALGSPDVLPGAQADDPGPGPSRGPEGRTRAAHAPLSGRRDALQPRAVNRLAYIWCEFLKWTTNPANFRESDGTPESLSDLDARRARAAEWTVWLAAPEQHRAEPPRTKRRRGLRPNELEAIERAIGPDPETGAFPTVFSRRTVFRNWMMYETARWCGLRRGELLKLQITDVPGVPDPREQSPRAWDEADLLMVFRRADDPEETRGVAPHVKTAERALFAPDSLIEDLQRYVTVKSPMSRPKPRHASPYLFLTDAGNPVSVDTARYIIRDIGEHAARWFEQHHPGVPHTLRQLTWHRLRHTRALELLPEFYDGPDASVDDFLKYFGWASMRSAQPYIDELSRRRANRAVKARNERDDERARVTQASPLPPRHTGAPAAAAMTAQAHGERA